MAAKSYTAIFRLPDELMLKIIEAAVVEASDGHLRATEVRLEWQLARVMNCVVKKLRREPQDAESLRDFMMYCGGGVNMAMRRNAPAAAAAPDADLTTLCVPFAPFDLTLPEDYPPHHLNLLDIGKALPEFSNDLTNFMSFQLDRARLELEKEARASRAGHGIHDINLVIPDFVKCKTDYEMGDTQQRLAKHFGEIINKLEAERRPMAWDTSSDLSWEDGAGQEFGELMTLYF